MLGEVTDPQFWPAPDFAGQRIQPAGQKFRQSGFAIAVRAKQRDAVVMIDAQVEMLQDRLVALVAGRNVIHGNDRRGGFLNGGREAEWRGMLLNHRSNRLHSLQHF